EPVDDLLAALAAPAPSPARPSPITRAQATTSSPITRPPATTAAGARPAPSPARAESEGEPVDDLLAALAAPAPSPARPSPITRPPATTLAPSTRPSATTSSPTTRPSATTSSPTTRQSATVSSPITGPSATTSSPTTRPPATTPPPLAARSAPTKPPPPARPAPAARAASEGEPVDDILAAIAEPAIAEPPPPAPPSPPAPPPPAELRGDPTFNDASGLAVDRGDPTLAVSFTGPDERDDATSVSAPPPPRGAARAATRATSGTLRSAAALPRKRGLAGDMRYVATVFFGVRKANRELAVLDAQQATRQQARRHHLTTLGRTAVALQWRMPTGGQADGEHPALAPARAQLAKLEAERLDNAGQVIAADEELAVVRAERDGKAKQFVADVAAIDAELAQLAKQLEPLEKEVGQVRKRAAGLRDAIRHIDGKIAATEASLAALKAGKASKLDPAAVQAELATLRADRKAIQADEPVIAGELDALTPRIAAIEAARGEAQVRRGELERAEHDDRRRVDDLLAAIGAKRKVVERAVADAEARRDKILLGLGEQLYVDRPDDLAGQLAPIEDIDVELGVADRRVMELREITSSVDRWKVVRGVLLLAVILAGVAALTWSLLTLFEVI
ncbi:MAG TPA: hypothetical protein VFP84_36290, partial [Kofleriaceae bacterium]|nr:hypothetical protein [Kofleriaceae bacterium]